MQCQVWKKEKETSKIVCVSISIKHAMYYTLQGSIEGSLFIELRKQ